MKTELGFGVAEIKGLGLSFFNGKHYQCFGQSNKFCSHAVKTSA
jgi:hypothetical protein